MKVYVAGKFEETVAVRAAQQALRDLGHEITHDWTQEDATGMEGDVLKAYYQKCAVQDYEGVLYSDVVLVLNHPKLFGGASEMGMALAWGRPVYVVNPQIRHNIFFDLPSGIRTFNTMEEAVAAIDADDFVELEG